MMRFIVSLIVYVCLLAEFEPGSSLPVFSEEDYHPGDPAAISSDSDSAASKKSIHHYCLFHVDLRCRDACIDLSFLNGKCYKGICVCKGAERMAIRKLRLSGQMIVPYLSPIVSVHDDADDEARSDSPVWFSAGNSKGSDRDIVYSRKMLDDLVEASQRRYDASYPLLSSTTGRSHRDVRPFASTPRAVRNDDDDGDIVTTASATIYAGATSESSLANRSHGRRHHRQRLHHYREHQHRVVDDGDGDDMIFELGHPQNLKGTIVGVAKEYDPQHLFSGEEDDGGHQQDAMVTATPGLPSVVVQKSNKDGDGATDVANLVTKYVE